MEKIIQELENKLIQSEEKLQVSESERRKLEDKNAELAKLVAYYEERFRLSQHKLFAQSSEKSKADENQTLLIFDEAENEADIRYKEPTSEKITYTRKKRAYSHKDDISSLPIEVIEHSIPEEERICPECGGQMHVMGHDSRQELTIIPAQVKVVEHRREIYSCRNCERNNITVPVIKTPMPKPVIKGSAASASFIAHIMAQKFINAVPLYRQEMSFLQHDFFLSRQTMANWLINTSQKWLKPIYEIMHRTLLKEEILHADETVLQVLKEPGRASRSESYMWLYRTGGYASNPIVLYEYKPTRSSSHPKEFLNGYTGYLHTDGYAGYKTLARENNGITLCGCWAHARRKFHEAVQALPPEEQQTGNHESQKGLEYCNSLFALERRYENISIEERHIQRLQHSKPITDQLFKWANALSVKVLPKSLLGKAVTYVLEQKPYLETFYKDGRLEVSNNRAERSIKPFVIGRKNWLFCCTPKGAESSSIIYSMIETAKANGLKPYEYLKHILETIPNIQNKEDYNTLLPWSKELPQSCRLKADKPNKDNDSVLEA